jgi:hypothetical protein
MAQRYTDPAVADPEQEFDARLIRLAFCDSAIS